MSSSLQQTNSIQSKIYIKVCSECKGTFAYSHKSKQEGSGRPDTCPLCGSPYWDKPFDEVRLFRLQEKYLQSGRDSKYLTEMYPWLYKYAENYTKNMMKTRFMIPLQRLHEVAHDASTAVIEKYLSDEEFYIHYSFGGNFKRILQGLLFGGKRYDKIASLDTMLGDEDNTSLEYYADADSSLLVDHSSIVKDSPELYTQKMVEVREYAINDIMKIIVKIAEIVREQSPEKALLLYAGLYGFFSHKNSASRNLFFTLYGNRINNKIENAKLFIREYLIALDSVEI